MARSRVIADFFEKWYRKYSRGKEAPFPWRTDSKKKSRQRKHGHSRCGFLSELLKNKGLRFLYCLFQRSEEL